MILLALVAGGLALARVTEQFVVTRLAHDRDTLIARLDTPGAPADTLPAVYRQPYSGHYFEIRRADGRTERSRSLWDARLDTRALAPGETRRSLISGPDGQTLLVLAHGVARPDGTATVSVAEDVGDLFGTVGALLGALAVGGALLGLATVLLQRRLLARQLAPLRRLEQETEQLQRGEVAHLSVQDMPEEVRPPVDAVNDLLDTLAHRLQRSRRALGDLAHALKTPLAALAQIEREPAMRDAPETAERLHRHVERSRRLIDAQMRRARVAGRGAGESVLLAAQVHDLVRTLERVHAERAIQLETHVADGLRFAGDREDLLEMLGVVLDNACQWTRARVRLTAAREGHGQLTVTVDDDGPGIESDRLVRLSERGVRLDESAAGSGLGLSIVRAIVEEYHGRMELVGHGGLGGFRVVLHLPAAPTRDDQSSSSSSSSS
jgi:signal transduction histidine kinase